MNRVLILPVLLAVLSLTACSRPESYEEFIQVDDSIRGRYEFELDMSDSLEVYDVSFYTRVDRGKIYSVNELPPLEIKVIWESPSGRVYDETVYMSSGDSRGVREKYRTGIEPYERGIWKLCVIPDDPPKGFRGLGIVFERYGTR